MRIKRLHIGDFGILQNQTLEHLHPGLVILGGHNRAGKSTFMQVLKYLGYGIPKGDSFPPANVEYMIDADVLEEKSGTNYHIRLKGRSEPICTIAGQGNRIPVSELYSVDFFTYQNIYNICLDQLARQPKGISDKEMNKLQSALLGAGLADIANIPHLQDKFKKVADNIGGVRGNPNVKDFKPHMELIKRGAVKKKHALAQVDEYNRQKNHLSMLEEQETSVGTALVKLRAKRDILETVKSNYEVLEETIALDHSLQHHEGAKVPSSLQVENRSKVEGNYETYGKLKQQWQKLYSQLAGSLEKWEQAKKVQSLLLNYRNLLQSFVGRLSGLQEKWNNVNGMKDRLGKEKNQLVSRIQQLNASWAEDDMDRIRRLDLELLESHRLMNEEARFQQIENKIEQVKDRMKEIEDNAVRIQTQIHQWKKQDQVPGLKLYLWASIISAVLGLAVSFLQPIVGLFLGIFGIIGSALFVFFKGLGHKEAGLRLKDLEGELKGVLATQQKLQQEEEQLFNEQKEVEAYLTGVCHKLGLNTSILPKGIYEYYRSISDIQQRIISLDNEAAELEEQSHQLTHQLKEIDGIVMELDNMSADIHGIAPASDRDVLNPDNWLDIQTRLKKWHNLMDIAIKLEQISQEIKITGDNIIAMMGQQDETHTQQDLIQASLEERVDNYLALCSKYSDYQESINKRDTLLQSLERAASSDRIQKAFHLLASDEVVQDKQQNQQNLFDIYNQHPVKDSLEREYKDLVMEVEDKEQELGLCRENIHKTNLLLEQLSLTRELEEAHDMIQKGRGGLYNVSYDYAVHRTAQWLCSEIRNEFMTSMKDELLHRADGILQQLTGEEYKRIIPNDNLSDFSFVLGDGSQQENSHILSRGTKEQVFLAVRLGRILEMQPALPVIIDDSLVNFDCSHLKQAISVIRKLGQTHQVFIMTCHPHLVEMFMETDDELSSPAQYWKLNKGRFSLSTGQELKEYLTLLFSRPS